MSQQSDVAARRAPLPYLGEQKPVGGQLQPAQFLWAGPGWPLVKGPGNPRPGRKLPGRWLWHPGKRRLESKTAGSFKDCKERPWREGRMDLLCEILEGRPGGMG